MPTLRIQDFDGLIPRQSPTTLADNQAQEANNVRLYSGELRPWNGSRLDQVSPVAAPASIYKLYGAADYKWLTWSAPVDVVPSPVTDTSDYRVYYTGDGYPKKTNWALTTAGAAPYPNSWYYLGVPAPGSAPTATVTTAGTGSAESLAYVYTHVSTFGAVKEESAPSPASTIVTPNTTGRTVTINGFAALPGAGYNITHRRIYRVVSGATTNNYQFVAEINVASTSYADTLATTSLGAVLGTVGWNEPPADLAGLVTLPSGALAGFSRNTVYFSEPYYPHAWPLRYALNVPYRIVGLGVVGSAVVVATERYPYIINGGIPGGMSLERVPIVEPCVAKRSVVSTSDGVVYASPNGLVAIGPSIRGLITTGLYRHDEWQALGPQNIVASAWNDKYVGVFPNRGTPGIVLNVSDKPKLSSVGITASAVYVDDKAADLYYADTTDNGIYGLDLDDNIPLTFEWKSKRFVLPQATTFSALKLDANYDEKNDRIAYDAALAATVAYNQGLTTDQRKAQVNGFQVNAGPLAFPAAMRRLPDFVGSRSLQVLLYGEGVLKATITPLTWDPVRIPPFKSRTLEVKLVGNISVRSITLATTAPELRV